VRKRQGAGCRDIEEKSVTIGKGNHITCNTIAVIAEIKKLIRGGEARPGQERERRQEQGGLSPDQGKHFLLERQNAWSGGEHSKRRGVGETPKRRRNWNTGGQYLVRKGESTKHRELKKAPIQGEQASDSYSPEKVPASE